jgi:Tetracyclin repressor-like, C-terminal domain
VHPITGLRKAVHAFFQSECDEAALRVALKDAAPLYCTAPQARARRKTANRGVDTFIAELMPAATKRERIFAADVLMTTMSALSKQISEQDRSQADVTAFADVTSDMVCSYLSKLARAQPAVAALKFCHGDFFRR